VKRRRYDAAIGLDAPGVQGGKKMQEKRQTAINRRKFLRAFGGASTTALAAAATTTLAPGEAQAYDPGDEETRSRYQETDHVKAYYRVNGYQTLKK
jgi:hypothetical protein